MIRALAAILAIVSVGCTIIGYAFGQELHQHTHEGAVGEFYQSWMQPPTREHSCCNEKDCYSTLFKPEGGKWFFLHRESGEWKPIPADKLEHNTNDPRDSPDGRGHVCASDYGFVFCAVVGSGT